MTQIQMLRYLTPKTRETTLILFLIKRAHLFFQIALNLRSLKWTFVQVPVLFSLKQSPNQIVSHRCVFAFANLIAPDVYLELRSLVCPVFQDQTAAYLFITKKKKFRKNIVIRKLNLVQPIFRLTCSFW